MKYLLLQDNPVATNVGLKRDIMDMFPNVEKIVSFTLKPLANYENFLKENIFCFGHRIKFVFEPRLPKHVLRSN